MEAHAHPAQWTAEGVGWDGYSLIAKRTFRETVAPREASPSGPAASGKPGRRPRTSVPCQVPGCGVELIGEKGYYRRYRICREHCNAPCSIIEGEELRFCRPCGRLHPVAEFEGTYKSCRRKLMMIAVRRRRATKDGSSSGQGSDNNTSETLAVTRSTAGETADGTSSCRSRGREKSSGSGGRGSLRGLQDLEGKREPSVGEEVPTGGASPIQMQQLLAGQQHSAGGPAEPAAGGAVPAEVDFQMEDSDLPFVDILLQELQGGDRGGVRPEAFKREEAESSSALPSHHLCQTLFNPARAVPEPNLPLGLPQPHAALGSAVPYTASDTMIRLSVKIFDCTPDQLPPDVKTQLEGMLGTGLILEGFIRPGCLHLILTVLSSNTQAAALCSADGLSACLAYLTETELFGDQRSLLIQASNLICAATARDPPLQPQFLKLGLPTFTAALPLCTLPGSCNHALQGVDMLSSPGVRLYCRQQGRNLTMDLHHRGQAHAHCSCSEVARAGLDLHRSDSCCPLVKVRGLEIGFADVEVQLGKVLSLPRAILVLPDPRAVEEVRSLEVCSAGIPDVDAFLRNTGLVMQYLHRAQALDPELSEALYTPDLVSRIGTMAQELVVAAVSRGWPALARLLLPAITAGGMGASAALSSMDALSPSTLLALAASAGSERAVEVLTEWAAAEGVDLPSPSNAAGLSEAVGPSDAAGTSLAEPAKPKAPASDRSGPVGTRQEFLAAFHRQQLWKQMVQEAMTLVMYGAFLFRVWRSGRLIDPRHLMLSLAFFIIPGLAIIILSYRRSPAFLRWRSPCVIALRLARGALGLVAYPDLYNQDFAHTLVLPSSPARLVGHLLRWPLVVLKGSVGLTLPLWSNAAATLAFLASYFHYMPRRCGEECALPGQGDIYQGLLGTVEGAHRASWYASSPDPASEPGGSCVYNCTAVNGWLMLYIGFVIPVWVLGLMEWLAWRRWQRRSGLTAGLVALHTCGMALASAACLYLAESGASLWR